MTSMYVFKGIKPVSSSAELIDIVLSRTQRKTPTEVHPGYQISRIRGFYMRKVKYVSQTFTEKFTDIITSFPKIDEIHPFFADLINILYDKDHYKIALSQVNIVNGIIENIAKDYVKLMKYGDSLYRCKTLKVAAFGRMCTAVKKINASLTYLEEVRRHLGRLPNVDAFSPTVLIFGFPNVGKSSFLNAVSNAKVEVSSMPFSTQNLFVGHFLYNNVKIQMIDSPGVLQRAIEERNTIEMQSLTALAHLRTAVLFIIDVSETSGYSIEEQIVLFRSLKPLFERKPVIIGLSKVDLLEGRLDLATDNDSEELIAKRKILEEFKQQEGDLLDIRQFSNEDVQSVNIVRTEICRKLLEFRLKGRKQTDGKKLKTDEDYLLGVTVQHPTVVRRSVNVKPNIPDSVRKMRMLKKQNIGSEFKLEEWKEKKMLENKTGKYDNLMVKKRRTLKDVAEELGGAGVFNFPMQEHFMLDKQEWKYDKVPEIWNGVNIRDYVDPEIEQKVADLEKEEDERLRILADGRDWLQEKKDELEWTQDQELLKQISEQKFMTKMDKKIKGKRRKKDKDLMMDHLRTRLQEKSEKTGKLLQKIKRNKKQRRNNRMGINKMAIEEETHQGNQLVIEGGGKRLRRSTTGKNRSVSQRGQYNVKSYKGEKLKRRIQKKIFKAGLKGDGDRGMYTKKPKHLFSGKMSNGTNDYR